MTESLDMLRVLINNGVRRVIATPHIYPGRFENEPEPLRGVFEQLLRARDSDGLDLELELGAEHFCDEHLCPRINRGDLLAFGPEKYVLFETSTGAEIPPHLNTTVETLRRHGYTPLMAHVERYRYLRDDRGEELLEDLRCMGVRFQVNRTVGKMNVPGVGGRGMMLSKLLDRGWIDEVGSDLHRPTQEGRPYASAA